MIKKRIVLFLFLAISFAGNAQMDVNTFKEQFVQNLWKTYPDWASSVGFHNYDSVLIIPDSMNRLKEIAFLNAQFKLLSTVKTKNLSDETDLKLIKNFITSSFWNLRKLKSHEWNPASYNLCGTFSYLLHENYAPRELRLKNIFKKLENVPAYYDAALANIKNPTAEHTKLAIDQHRNAINVFDNEIMDAVTRSGLPGVVKRTFSARCEAASKAVKNYINKLDSLDNPNPRSFRLGKDLYETKFKNEIFEHPDTIFQRALARKQFLHTEMSKLTDQLWPKYFGNKVHPRSNLRKIKMMIDTLSASHCEADSFQSTIEKQIPALVKFVNDKKLIGMDPTKPLVVRREPEYMAGVAGASISSPGPYEKNGNTYYNVGSLSGWSPEDKESYLREYNDYILQILNIHEAIPGHYVQLIYSNRAPSLIKSLFGNNSMIEGWAVYSELMMLENGYGDSTAEMWLMYYKWNLRSVCNTILDISIHTKDLKKEDAMNLLTIHAFQQQKEAEGKWKRATLSDVQLCSYFSGFSQILELRNKICPACREKPELLRLFHEKFLSYGSIPVKEIEKLMRNGN